jgi:hypothetical protein
MNEPFQRPPPVDPGRRSKQVALVLLGTMGVVGGIVAWDAWQRTGEENNPSSSEPHSPPAPIAADRTYNNNDFIPGVGYYHAPYHAWYPFSYNHYDPLRGYFAGGLWQAVPFAMTMLSSRPNNNAVAAALAAQQRDQEQRARAGSSNFVGARTSPTGTSSFSSRPAGTPPPSKSSPSIQRGGFGSSGHGSGGSS